MELKTPVKISGIGHLIAADGFVLAHCSDGIPCAEMKEVVSIVNSHKDLLEALEAIYADWLSEYESWDLSSQEALYPLKDRVRAAIAKARGE